MCAPVPYRRGFLATIVLSDLVASSELCTLTVVVNGDTTPNLCRVTSVFSACYAQNAKIAQSSWMKQRFRFGFEGAETETLHLVAGAGRFQLGLTQAG